MNVDDWTLESAEARHDASPETFWIPSRAQREGLQPGDGAKLLFQNTSERGSGIERMWVIVRRRLDGCYVGVLDSTPLDADSRSLQRGSTVVFAPEHIADISTPDREYVVARYGEEFFDNT